MNIKNYSFLVSFIFLLLTSKHQKIFCQNPDSLKPLVVGVISIFSDGSNYYLQKGDELVQIPKKKQEKIIVNGEEKIRTSEPYKGFLKYYLSDCKEIDTYLKSIHLNSNSLIKLLKQYYSCINDSTPKFTDLERNSLIGGIITGVQHTSMKMRSPDREYSEASFNSETPLVVGILLEYQFTADNIGIGLEYFQFSSDLSFTGSSDFNEGGTKTINDFNIEFRQSQSRIYFTKNWTINRIAPHIKLGPSIIFNNSIKQNRQKREILSTGTEVEIYNGNFFKEKNLRMAFSLGAGVGYEISKKFMIDFDIRYDLVGDLNKSVGSDVQIVSPSISALIILRYKLSRG